MTIATLSTLLNLITFLPRFPEVPMWGSEAKLCACVEGVPGGEGGVGSGDGARGWGYPI